MNIWYYCDNMILGCIIIMGRFSLLRTAQIRSHKAARDKEVVDAAPNVFLIVFTRWFSCESFDS